MAGTGTHTGRSQAHHESGPTGPDVCPRAATFELAARLDAKMVTVNALHPGSLLDTKMVREGFGAAQGPVETGIESETYLATSPDLDGATGAYFDRTQPDRAVSQAYSATDRERLWALSEELVGLA